MNTLGHVTSSPRYMPASLACLYTSAVILENHYKQSMSYQSCISNLSGIRILYYACHNLHLLLINNLHQQTGEAQWAWVGKAVTGTMGKTIARHYTAEEDGAC